MTNEQIIKLFLDIAGGVLSREEVERLFRQYVES